MFIPSSLLAGLSSMSHLGREELFQPLSPKAKDQTLLPAHGMDNSAKQEHEDIGLGTKTAEGVHHCHNPCLSKAKPECRIKMDQATNLSSRSHVLKPPEHPAVMQL